MQYESCSHQKQTDYMKIPDSNYLVPICIRKIWIWPSFRRLLAFCWRLKRWRPDNLSTKSVKIWWPLCRMQCCAKASYGRGSVVDVVSQQHHSNLILIELILSNAAFRNICATCITPVLGKEMHPNCGYKNIKTWVLSDFFKFDVNGAIVCIILRLLAGTFCRNANTYKVSTDIDLMREIWHWPWCGRCTCQCHCKNSVLALSGPSIQSWQAAISVMHSNLWPCFTLHKLICTVYFTQRSPHSSLCQAGSRDAK